jgi:hypothetical protein
MTTTAALLAAWFQGRLPDGWFVEPVEVRADRDEILVVGVIPAPDLPDDAGEEARAVAQAARIGAFRDQTRDQRVAVAREAEHRFERKVAWAVRCGEREEAFTTASVPVMTRLRMPERRVLDTLIDAGIARSRSEALAWCVRLVGRNQAEWIDQLREAMAHVEKVRAEGPSA